MTASKNVFKSSDRSMNKALKAVDKILQNLEDSDFVANAGRMSLQELRQYRVDMAADIAAEFDRE